METSRLILNHIDDPDTSFVFPSELTARFWCRRALRVSSRRSIISSRFLSWDQFKESCFAYPSTARPANRAIRMLFLHHELERNRRSPYLRRIVPPMYAGQPLVFLEPLQRLLPVLHRLSAVRSRWPGFSRERLEDLEGLHAAYRAFLERSRLYEPSFERPRFSPGSRNYLLFFPELIEDYAEFADLLGRKLRRIPAPPELRAGTSVEVFDTLPEEIRAVIRRIALLLDGGVSAQEIVLTVGDLENLEPLLRREAELFSLPLEIHLGRPLCRFPQVLMLHKAYSAADSSFSLHGMKALLLCSSIPWKQDRLCRALVRLALDGRIAGNAGAADNWAASLAAARRQGNPRKLPLSRVSGFYFALKDSLAAIACAGSFPELKSRLVSFVSDYLDLGRLGEEERRAYQFAVDTLNELEEAEELVCAGGGARSGAAFPLWWLYLGQRLYVPGRYSPGVAVFPFRVSEGMEPEHHFVVNASQAATTHIVRRYPFLKLHEEQSLPEAQRELAAAHLQLYSHGGENVTFSYARRDFQRSNLPPPVFLAHGVTAVQPDAPLPPDPYELERQAWIDGTPFPLQEIQHCGYRSAAIGVLAARDIDGTRQALQDGRLIPALSRCLQDAEGRFRISATALERFSLCPFQFLFEHLLGVREEDYEPEMIDPIDIGILLHRVVERFFARAGSGESARPATLLPDRAAEYRRRLKGMVARICSEYRRDNPALLAPIAEEIRRRIEELVLAFLEIELATMADERVEGTEVSLRAPAPEMGAVLVGTIDRLGRNPSGYTLIDYKKKGVPSRGDLFSGQPVSLQMPFYVHLLELERRSVTRAAYYSFENRRYHFVFGGPGTNMGGPEEIRAAVAEVKRRVVAMRQRISEGDFRIQVPGAANCSLCRLDFVCRRGYGSDG